ncbi:uncharacterized protein LOC136027665 [Artemia franciscana]|uniref:uncharacterized protein LOC136027665 n=1 Tax=Artemia franciscana TaxID=6661 RepID=UPI0032DB2C6A
MEWRLRMDPGANQPWAISFINEVKSRPVLYVKKGRSKTPGEDTRKEWQEIGEKFGLEPIDCQKKWKCFRDVYIRERKKEVDKRRWYWYPFLTFLEPHVITKKPGFDSFLDYEAVNGEGSNPTQTGRISVKEEVSEHEEDEEKSSSTRFMHEIGSYLELVQTEEASNGTRHQHKEEEEEPRSKRFKHFNGSPIESGQDERIPRDGLSLIREEDADEAFCRSVAADLKQLNCRDKALAKYKIQEVLYKVTSGVYEEQVTNKGTSGTHEEQATNEVTSRSYEKQAANKKTSGTHEDQATNKVTSGSYEKQATNKETSGTYEEQPTNEVTSGSYEKQATNEETSNIYEEQATKEVTPRSYQKQSTNQVISRIYKDQSTKD